MRSNGAEVMAAAMGRGGVAEEERMMEGSGNKEASVGDGRSSCSRADS